MTRLFRSLLLFIPLLLLPTCTHTPRNGWLDGQWQLVARNGEDMKSRRIYWRFQLDLMELYSPIHRLATEIPYTNVVCRFSHEGQALTLTSAYFVLRGEGRDSLITPAMKLDLTPLGIKQVPTRFRIVSSSSSAMTFEQEGQTWEFRRF